MHSTGLSALRRRPLSIHTRYDGLNRLIETASDFVSGAPQTVTHDYYAGDQLLETRVATGAGAAADVGDSLLPQYQYVWSPRGTNAPILRDTYSGGSLVTSDRIYYLTDANNNVTAVTDPSGNVLERYVYSAYGGVMMYDGPTSAGGDWSDLHYVSSQSNTVLFAGMQLDPTTGQYYDNARWYNSSTGGFDHPRPGPE